MQTGEYEILLVYEKQYSDVPVSTTKSTHRFVMVSAHNIIDNRETASAKGGAKIISRWLFQAYGMTTAQYAVLLEQQQGVCAICGRAETSTDYHSKQLTTTTTPARCAVCCVHGVTTDSGTSMTPRNYWTTPFVIY